MHVYVDVHFAVFFRRGKGAIKIFAIFIVPTSAILIGLYGYAENVLIAIRSGKKKEFVIA